VLKRLPEFKPQISIEEIYGQKKNLPARVPLAGIAVSERLVEQSPEIVRLLLESMQTEAEALRGNLDSALDVLPAEFNNTVDKDVLRASLDRDVILVEPASAVLSEIVEYFRVVSPSLVNQDDSKLAINPQFIWPDR
jgi:hypothetical protein